MIVEYKTYPKRSLKNKPYTYLDFLISNMLRLHGNRLLHRNKAKNLKFFKIVVRLIF